MGCTNCGREMCECPPWVNHNLSSSIEPFPILTPGESQKRKEYQVVEERLGYKKEKNGIGQVKVTKDLPGGGIAITEYWE